MEHPAEVPAPYLVSLERQDSLEAVGEGLRIAGRGKRLLRELPHGRQRLRITSPRRLVEVGGYVAREDEDAVTVRGVKPGGDPGEQRHKEEAIGVAAALMATSW